MVPKLQDFRAGGHNNRPRGPNEFQTNSATRFQRSPQMQVQLPQPVSRLTGKKLIGSLGGSSCQTGFESHGGTANQPDSTRYCLYLGVHRSPRKVVEGTFVLVAAIFDPFANLPLRVCLPGPDWRSVLAIPLVGLGNRILLPCGKGLFALC